MPDTTPGSPMARWWAVIAVVAVVLIVVVFVATRHSQHVDATATANGTGHGRAYDATTDSVVPADATSNSVRMGAPNTLGEPVNATSNTAG